MPSYTILFLLVIGSFLSSSEAIAINYQASQFNTAAYDVCIIGAGMFGSAAAKFASENRSLKVCLIGPEEPTPIEQKHREVFSSYYDSGRMTRLIDEEPARVVLARESIKRYRDIEKQSGIKFYYPVGLLNIVPKNGSTFKNLMKSASTLNFPVKELSKSEFSIRYPAIRLKEDETALLDENGAGHIDPRKMVEAQKKIAKRQGCDVINEVVECVTLKNGFYKIRTEKGLRIRSKKLIIATGAFVNYKSFHVLRPLNVMKFKQTLTLFEISTDEYKKFSSLPNVIYEGNKDEKYPNGLESFFFTPILYPDGKYYIKAGIENYAKETPSLNDLRNWYLSEGNRTYINAEITFLKEVLRDLKYISTKGVACVYCNTLTGLPYIDRITPTLTVAIGGNGRSAKSSDEIGRLAAKLSIAGIWDSELDKRRFKAIFLN